MSSKYKFHNPDGIYFVSFSVVDWMDPFVRAIYKHILIDSIKYCQKEKGLLIHAWCIMPSHVHLIISRKGELKLEDILRDMKKFTAYKILGAIMDNHKESRREWMLEKCANHGKLNPNNSKYQFWQQDNHPVELSTNEMLEQRLDYVHNNPVEEEFVEYAEEYLYSSARDYSDRKGLLDIVRIE
jgi:putative transposase